MVIIILIHLINHLFHHLKWLSLHNSRLMLHFNIPVSETANLWRVGSHTIVWGSAIIHSINSSNETLSGIETWWAISWMLRQCNKNFGDNPQIYWFTSKHAELQTTKQLSFDKLLFFNIPVHVTQMQNLPLQGSFEQQAPRWIHWKMHSHKYVLESKNNNILHS